MFPVKVDRSDSMALHDQVAAEIRKAIAEGEAGPGERLPLAKDIAAVLGVNKNTVLRAMHLLRDEGTLGVHERSRDHGDGDAGEERRPAPGARPRRVRPPPGLPARGRNRDDCHSAMKATTLRSSTEIKAVTVAPPQQHLIDAPQPDLEVLFKEAKLRRRRRRLGWLILAICVAVATTLLVTRDTGTHAPTQRTHQGSPRTSFPAGTPAEIVAWTSNHHVVVISTRTGAILRTLASDVAVFEPGLPDLSVSPQGEVFFNSAPIAGVSPPDAQGDQIFSVPITGGPYEKSPPGFLPR